MNSDMRPAVSGLRFPWLALISGVVVFAILMGLGFWQLRRLAWKENLIATIDARINSEPRPLADIERQFTETRDVDYTPVEVSGRFLNDKETHFFATFDGESGFYVYTPLQLDGTRVVLVNRGFVPYDRKEASTRGEGQVEGERSVVGLARNPLPGKPSSMVPDNDPAKNIFYWKDLTAMAAKAALPRDTQLLPFFIDAGASPNPGGLPVGGVTMVEQPNSHLQYAVTWFGLAAALAGVFVVWFWRRLRPS